MRAINQRVWPLVWICALALPIQTFGQKLWDGENNDLEWTNNVNWGVLNTPGENIQPGPNDTCNFVGAAATQTNIYVSADTTVQRVQLRNNTTVSRTIQIGTNSTGDITIGMSGTTTSLLANQKNAAGFDLNFSGIPNTYGARLKLRIDQTKSVEVTHAASSITVSCDMYGNAAFQKNGAGTFHLSGYNTYIDTATVNAGTVKLGSPQALGFGGFGGTVVSSGAVLDLNGQSGVNEILTLNGTGISSAGALINSSGTGASIAGGLISSISVTAGGSGYTTPPDVTISGGGGSGATATALLGLTTASITLDNGGSGYDAAPFVVISGGGGSGATATATLTGDVVTSITVTAPGWGYTNAPTISFVLAGVTGSGATATANANNFTVSAVSLTAAGSGYSGPTVGFSGGGGGSGATATANLMAVTLVSDSSVGGTGSITIESAISGTGSLTKVGSNSLILTGANAYTGATTVSAGSLLVNNPGSLAAGSAVTVASGGTLGGNGSVGGSVTVDAGGTASPGASVGALAVGGDLTLSGNLLIEVNKTLSPSNDVINVTGTLTNAGTGTVTVANLGPALTVGDSFQLFNKAVGGGEALSVVGGGATWTNKLAVDGSIAVVSLAPPPSPATNVTIVATGPASVSLGGLGAANSAYDVYASTNVALPMSSWWLLGTTNSDAGGLIQFLDPQATNDQRFYRFGQTTP